MKTIDSGTTEKHHVVIGAEHPVAGYLYFELIPDCEAGLADIYQLTDTLRRADVFDAGWRDWSFPNFQDGNRPAYEEILLPMHIERILWEFNDEIRRVCHVHGITVKELRQWSQDISRWRDIPVVSEMDCNGEDYEAVSLIAV